MKRNMKEEVFLNAKWIWIHGEDRPDEYAEFVFGFEGDKNSRYTLSLTADSNYNVYLNGKLVGFGQPTDYPTYKIYDDFSLDEIVNGKNEVKIVAWYYGVDTQAYIKDVAGAIFELRKDGKTIYVSNEKTQGRLCVNYENYRQKDITKQLGFGYKYIAGAVNNERYHDCVVRDKNRNFHLRATEKLLLKERVPMEIRRLENCWLIDMGAETVGFLDLDIESDRDAVVTIAYGEYLKADGNVNRFF